MSQTLLPLAGFEVTFNGRFWVTAEDQTHRQFSKRAVDTVERIGAVSLAGFPEEFPER
jgi:hypothetical protein